MESLVDGGLLVEGEASINLSGDLSWDDSENLLSELDEESVESSIDLGVNVRSVLLSVAVSSLSSANHPSSFILHPSECEVAVNLRNGGINQVSVLWLLGSSEDERWVGGGILWVVLGDSGEVSAVYSVSI